MHDAVVNGRSENTPQNADFRLFALRLALPCLPIAFTRCNAGPRIAFQRGVRRPELPALA